MQQRAFRNSARARRPATYPPERPTWKPVGGLGALPRHRGPGRAWHEPPCPARSTQRAADRGDRSPFEVQSQHRVRTQDKTGETY